MTIDEEKSFDKIHYIFMIKKNFQQGVGKFDKKKNLQKSIPDTTLNHEKLDLKDS
jgi:hypothetical protein